MMQLIVSKTFSAKELSQVYEANHIAIQPIAPLKDDHKASSFKKYVNETFVPDAKKTLASDASASFAKEYGWDVARVTVKKDGKPYRFVFLKNGLHPMAVISKEETAAFKKIESSITDVEKTDLKKESAPLKTAIQKTSQLIRDKNAAELYKQSAKDLRDKNTQDQISKLLVTEEVYSQGTITINGGSYDDGSFAAVVNFAPLNKDFKPASGVLYLKKVSGQWKLTGMQLPNPLSNKATP